MTRVDQRPLQDRSQRPIQGPSCSIYRKANRSIADALSCRGRSFSTAFTEPKTGQFPLNLGALILISITVGLDNSAVAVAFGISGIPRRERVRIALTFGLFEFLMPIAGLWLGSGVAEEVGSVGRLGGALLLIATGLYAYWKTWTEEREPGTRGAQAMAGPRLMLTAFALSLDNLVVGFALSMADTPPLLAGVTMISASVVMTLLALELGHQLGRRIEQCSEEISAVVLILVGVALATGILG